VIGTRGSKLALWQTEWVKSQIEKHHPDLEIEIAIIKTRGDRILDVSLSKLGEQGKGLFTKELEDAMLDGRIDLAVHSLKDLPVDFTPGLHLSAVCEREDARDALVARAGINSFAQIPTGSIIGTSSLRRIAQLCAIRPDIKTAMVRGNVDTRIAKLDAGQYDALLLAAAGLRRLGHADRITEYLSQEMMMPAVGQGALGIESRIDDRATNEVLRALDHEPTRLACEAERAMLRKLGGGCLVPIAAFARIEGDLLRLSGLVASTDGAEIVRGEESGSPSEAAMIGERLAKELTVRGADRLLEK
jgi:hydroxymethylbilane synthase